jgi:CRP-like cAMP-binding protein
MRTNHLQTLAGLELFEGCGGRQLRVIDSSSTVIDVQQGRTLCREGEIGSEFFVIIDGAVTVRRDARVLATLSNGDWFGEIALSSGSRRRVATVETSVPSRLLVFNGREFRRLVDACPLVEHRVAESVFPRLASCFGARRMALA